MKYLIIAILILIPVYYSVCADIESTREGGNWNDPATWTANKIPDKNDNVFIKGSVKINTPIECGNLKIDRSGNLEFVKSDKKMTSQITISLYIEGIVIIGENWTVNVFEQIKRDDKTDNNLHNFGIITVGH